MAEHVLRIASRHLKRQFERAIGNSIPKILTELITNSDDSYRRLSSGDQAVFPISILFDRKARKFSVVDQAEGLTDQDMVRSFVTYGEASGDKEKGFNTRSLFGKGLRDVLFTQHYGEVKSIKDNKLYICKFRWKNENPIVNITAPKTRVTPKLRKALGIKGNGTRVEFILSSKIPTPQTKRLVAQLKNFYMLRMLNCNVNRKIRLCVVGSKNKEEIHKFNYKFPRMDVQDEFDISIETEEGDQIQAKGQIGLTKSELAQGEVGYVDRQGGLLIIDEDDSVLDLTLFGLDEEVAARRISGLVRLDGVGAYVRGKLNQSAPEEVLTETRDGFDTNHPFYFLLKNTIRPRLEKVVQELREQRRSSKSKFSQKTLVQHKKALEILNKAANDLLGETGRQPIIPDNVRKPPLNGLEFLTNHVTIQAGISTPLPLLINTEIVDLDEEISVSSSIEGLIPTPSSFELAASKASENPAIKIIQLFSRKPGLEGEVIAKIDNIEAKIKVFVTERHVITPVNGLEFERPEYVIKLGSSRTLKLFVDLQKIPIGSRVKVIWDEQVLGHAPCEFEITESQRVTEDIAQISFSAKGHQLCKSTVVVAESQNPQYETKADLKITKGKKRESGKHGLFSQPRFENRPEKHSCIFDTFGGEIIVNTNDKTNEKYFGEEPEKAVETIPTAQIRLAELVLNVCLNFMVTRALENGRLERKFPNNPEIDLYNYVEELRFEIGPAIHELFVTKL